MAPSPWLVPITAIRRTPGARREEVRRGPVEALAVASSSVPEGAEAEADVVLDVISGGIEVHGEIRAPWQAECRRCLRPVRGELCAEVRELYRPRREGERADEDEETYPLSGELLDLRPLVRDAILLALPLAPLCAEDCVGLCPTCGADLAAGPCGCNAGAGDPRWGVLDSLRPRGEG